MKFRAKINTDTVIREFVQTLDLLSKMGKTVFFHITSDKFTMATIHDELDSEPCLWATVNTNSYFDTYIFEWNSQELEQVYFLIQSSNLSQSLAGLGKATNYFRLRLSDDPFTCIAIQTETPGQLANHKKIKEIPISVVPKRNWPEFKLPTESPYDLKIEIANLVLLRKMIDAMKHLSPEMDVSINPNGSLYFSITETEFTTKIAFDQLMVTALNQNFETDDGSVQCTISTKRFGQILTNNTFKRALAHISIKNNSLFKIEFVVREGLVVNYVIPALFNEP